MPYSVTIYCPDRHILYDARMPDRKGVGGGITARLRLAQALAKHGSQVTVVANVPHAHAYKGVSYEPLDGISGLKADVVILNTTGGALDLRPVLDLEVLCRLTEVWVGGVARVHGLSDISYDCIVVPSNFIRQVVVDDWHMAPHKVFVLSNGLQRYSSIPPSAFGKRRDPFRLVYTGHPSKGLSSALAVQRLLREQDPRFELHVYGGNELWGGEDQPPESAPGVFYHGRVGQRKLARELQRSGVAIHLQAIQEAFGISLIEAMAAGSIVVASPVGAYAAAIRHGYDGFLIPGNHEDSEVRATAAAWILELTRNPDLADYVRRNAMPVPFDWSTIAKAWHGHWQWMLDKEILSSRRAAGSFTGCSECSGDLLPLADGYHCVQCGLYDRGIPIVDMQK